jgi:hypothetical protein
MNSAQDSNGCILRRKIEIEPVAVLTGTQRRWGIHHAQDIQAQPFCSLQKGIAAVGRGACQEGNTRWHDLA